MKLPALFALVISILAAQTYAANLVCYYDSSSFIREGPSRFTMDDLDHALQFCTHLVYGYVGIKSDTFQIMSINPKLDIQKRHFATITELKDRNPHIKFLLSVGGDKDLENPEKYVNLLEAGRKTQNAFIESARSFLKMYNFDGLDLAFQLPRNKPKKVHSEVGAVWKNFKKFFTGDFIVDEKAEEHREAFTDLVKDLRNTLLQDNLMLTLTVLPNVNSSWYYDAPAIINHLDFVNLAAFDFITPDRNPKEADFSAPLYELYGQDRLSHYDVNYQVEHWILQRVPVQKIVVGVPTYGRAWKMTAKSGFDGMPVIKATDGPAPEGSQTKTPGLLSYPEVCTKLPSPSNLGATGADAPLRKVVDPTKKYGTYAFRTSNENDENGIWISYEDPDTAGNKAGYVKVKYLGGVALFDITLDDIHGQCAGEKFPILKAVKHRLL